MKESLIVSFLALTTAASHIHERIQGGQDIQNTSDILHHVTIGIYPTTENETYCEGSVLSARHVLTAAVCFDKVLVPNYKVVILFGAVDLENATTARLATKVRIHPDWDTKTLQNNLAILEFQPVLLSDKLQPIRLPLRNQSVDSFASWNAKFIGRGQSSNNDDHKRVLQVAETKVIKTWYCRARYILSATISDGNICTWQDSEGICKGDEGGSLFVIEAEDRDRPTLIGVASFKGGDCGDSLPSVFTQVAAYLPWINAVTSIPIREEPLVISH